MSNVVFVRTETAHCAPRGRPKEYDDKFAQVRGLSGEWMEIGTYKHHNSAKATISYLERRPDFDDFDYEVIENKIRARCINERRIGERRR